jgi:hypothetical protein
MEDLDSILSDEPTELKPEAPVETGQPRDEHGRFAPKDDGTTETGVDQAGEIPAEVPPTSEPTKELPPAEYAALRDERRKRQQLERELQELQQRVNQPVTAPSPPPDFWESPEAALEAKFNQFGEQLMQRIEAQQWQRKAANDEQSARAKYADFDDKLEQFHQLAASNPALINELRAAPDVAEFAYRKASEAMLLQDHGGVEGLLKAERAKWEAELRGSAPVPPTVPLSTAAERSVGSRSGPAWVGPVSLDDLLR